MINLDASSWNTRGLANSISVSQMWSASSEAPSLSHYNAGIGGPADIWSPSRQQTSPTVEGLRAEINYFRSNYHDGWDGPGSFGPTDAASNAILKALDAMPSGIALPKSMLSPNGDIGLYWDFSNGGYADLCADSCGQLTFFSRDRQGIEHFDDVRQVALSAQWYWRQLMRITRPDHHAA